MLNNTMMSADMKNVGFQHRDAAASQPAGKTKKPKVVESFGFKLAQLKKYK